MGLVATVKVLSVLHANRIFTTEDTEITEKGKDLELGKMELDVLRSPNSP